MRPDEYIFCQLCGGAKWLSDKTSNTKEARLSLYKCTGCKKFTYINASTIFKDTILHAVTQLKRYSVKAEVGKYHITVLYFENQTVITDLEKNKEILTINKAVDFNWYQPNQVEEKIKFYLVFS